MALPTFEEVWHDTLRLHPLDKLRLLEEITDLLQQQEETLATLGRLEDLAKSTVHAQQVLASTVDETGKRARLMAQRVAALETALIQLETVTATLAERLPPQEYE